MTEAIFHVQAADDALSDLQFTCYLIALYTEKKYALSIFGPHTRLVELSRMLWFFPADCYLPHLIAEDTLILTTPYKQQAYIQLNPTHAINDKPNLWIEPVFTHEKAKKEARMRYKAHQQLKHTINTIKEPLYG